MCLFVCNLNYIHTNLPIPLAIYIIFLMIIR